MNTISLHDFTLSCRNIIEKMRKTGIPIIITDNDTQVVEIRPLPVYEKKTKTLGTMRNMIQISGDIVSPVCEKNKWEVLRD